MPINGHDLGKRLVNNFRNQINFGGGFDDVKAVFEYAVALERELEQNCTRTHDHAANDCSNTDEMDEHDEDEDGNCGSCGDVTGTVEELYEFTTPTKTYRVVARNLSEATEKLASTQGTNIEASVTGMKKIGAVTV